MKTLKIKMRKTELINYYAIAFYLAYMYTLKSVICMYVRVVDLLTVLIEFGGR